MIIGLVGFKQVGKSTAAKHLEEKYNAKRINMKDALVAEIKKNFPDLLDAIVEAEFYKADLRDDGTKYDIDIDWLFENKPPLMRTLLQNYGTEVRRGDNDSYWTDRWEESVAQQNKHQLIVTDDVRFLNEAAVVQKRGGIIIRLTRPDIATGGMHASETEQLKIVADHVIECEQGDHAALYAALDKLMQQYE